MNANSTLYWSTLIAYENCGQQMLWAKGWGMFDVGGGPGLPKPIPVKESRHHAVMGLVLASAMEKLYNDELWTDPKNLTTNLLKFLDEEWFRQVKDPRNYIDYNKARLSAAEMLEVTREGVIGYVQTMKAHSLLSMTYARSEVDLIGWVDKWNPIGGRTDLLFRRKEGVTIIDGKNTRKREDADADQLRWYGLLYRLAYKEMPHRLGFAWFRYPYGMEAFDNDGNRKYDEDGNPMIEQGVEWVPFTIEDFRGLAHRAVEAKAGMRKELFPANPVPSYCRYCVYESVCKERQAQKAANAEKRGKKKRLDMIEDGGGFSDFSL